MFGNIAVRFEISVVTDIILVIMAYTTAFCDTVSADVGDFIVRPEKILHEYVGPTRINVRPARKPSIINFERSSAPIFHAKSYRSSNGSRYL